jgi:hypothetical protein
MVKQGRVGRLSAHGRRDEAVSYIRECAPTRAPSQCVAQGTLSAPTSAGETLPPLQTQAGYAPTAEYDVAGQAGPC